jgi:anti-sigma factor RsiW
MECGNVLELIEPIAAGDLLPGDEVRDHLQSCPRCAAALASARRVEALLQGMEIPAAPAAFTGAVVQRIRSDKWRSEQNVDRLFNGAIAAAVLLVIGGVAALFNVDVVLSLSASVWAILQEGSRETVRTAVPTVGTYIAAFGLLASALGMWYWAERRVQL